MAGIEPAPSVWKTEVLPFNYIRMGGAKARCTT